MIVLSRINLHPGHTPEDIAKGLRARRTWTRSQVLCGTRTRRAHRAGDAALTDRSGHGPLLGLARNGFANTRATFLVRAEGERYW